MCNKILPYLFLFPFLIWVLPMALGHGDEGDVRERNRMTSTPWIVAKDRPRETPGTGGHEALQDQIEGLMDELKRLEEDIRGKIQEKMIPLIRREIKRLRKWLEELRHDEDPQEPVMTHFKDENPLAPTPFG